MVLLALGGVSRAHPAATLVIESICGGLGTYFVTAHQFIADLGQASGERRLDRRIRVHTAPTGGRRAKSVAQLARGGCRMVTW